MPPTNLTLLSGRYLSFAEREEIALLHAQKFSVRAAADVPVFVHVRSASRIEPGSSIQSVAEVIAAAAVSGAALHIVHINSSCLGDAGECLA